MGVSILTENGVLRAAGLARPPVDVEVSMSVWAPLAENARACVDHIYEVSVRRIKVMGPVVSHVEQDGRVQTCNSVVSSMADASKLLLCFGTGG
jgi:hypothetical protein